MNSVESKIRLAALGLPADAVDESGDGSCPPSNALGFSPYFLEARRITLQLIT
jgi:hypothetical protein